MSDRAPDRAPRRSERIFILESRKAAEAKRQNEKNRTRLEGAQEASSSRGPKANDDTKRKTTPILNNLPPQDSIKGGQQFDANAETDALPKPSEDSPTSQPLPSVPLAAGRSNEQRSELLARWWPTSTSRGPPRDDAMLSLVLDSPQTLELVNPMKYSESLMRFVKDLGPTAQRVAMRKIREAEAAASMYPMEAASGSCSHPWAPSNQVDGVQMPPREFSAGSSSVPRADLAVLPQGITAGSSSAPRADLAVPSQEIHPPPASEPFTDAAIGQRVLGSRRQTAGTEHPNQRRRMFSWVQPTGVAPDPDADDPSLKEFKFDWFTARDNLANLPPPPVVPVENPPPPAVEPEAESSAAKDTAEDVGSSKSRKP